MDARYGSRHHGTFIKLSGQSDKQVLRSARSYYINVVEHKAKIFNPSSYVENWEGRGKNYKAGIAKKWQKDIDRNQELFEIALEILRERGLEDEWRAILKQ